MSYDVTALFICIPIRDTIRVIKSKLEKDPKFQQQRGELAIGQVITLLEFCLHEHHLLAEGRF